MTFDMKRPCDNCPFLKVGGIRLTFLRVQEVAGGMLSTNGAKFACHKTVEYDFDGEGANRNGQKHCAGALIFAEKHQTATQMMRISEGLGDYNAASLMSDKAAVKSVFDSLRQMQRAAIR